MSNTPEQHVSAEVKRWRNRRQLSADALAKRVARFGGRLSRQAISKIENGERGVSLNEVLLLAAALAVPPPLLFMPLDSAEPIAVTPTQRLLPSEAWEWLAGDLGFGDFGDEWSEARRGVRLHQALRHAQGQWGEAELEFRVASASGNASRIAKAQERRADALREMAKALEALMEEGLIHPAQQRQSHPDSMLWLCVDQMLELGLLKNAGAFARSAEERNGG